jgi:hypothetical protein
MVQEKHMPQPRKYETRAEQQAAYRKRRILSDRELLDRKGLPPLPAIPSIPGWPRWNAIFKMAHALMEGAVSEQLEYFDDRSESWQAGERGQDHQERTASAEAVRDALQELTS